MKELEGIHARGDYDLSQHAQFSGQDLSYFDAEKSEHYLPHIIESSVGVGRTLLALLCEVYEQEEVEGQTRVVLKFKPALAPIKIAILPLSKKGDLCAKAREIFDTLKDRWMVDYDETQSIGKRYRRQDEIGTPYCITVDFDSLNDGCVTVRDRDTMQQERILEKELVKYLNEKFGYLC
jgi:glycyl-tRNA synthetase